MADTRQSQGCTLGWYASPRWGGFRLIFTIANAMNDLIIYTTEDGRRQIKLRAKDQTVWLSQREMSQKAIRAATNNHNKILKELGLSALP